MVRIHPDPPGIRGAVAQLGEHLLCKQGVVGSIPSSSTSFPGTTIGCERFAAFPAWFFVSEEPGSKWLHRSLTIWKARRPWA